MSNFVTDLRDAISAHDIEAMVSCFTEDYRCDMPVHPEQGFVGQGRVRANWSALFARIPDIEAHVLRSVQDGDHVWSEWEIGGTTTTGSAQLFRGVVIAQVVGDQAAQANFYLDPVD